MEIRFKNQIMDLSFPQVMGIVNMTPEKYASLFGSEDGYYSEEFKLLKDFFMQTGEIDLSKILSRNFDKKKFF